MKQKFILILLLSWSLVSNADEYSDALDAEASGMVVETRTNEKNKAAVKAQNNWSFSAQSLLDELPPKLPKKQFESTLKELFYGSFIFYSKLKPKQSDFVFKAYEEGMGIEKLRSLITDEYKKSF